MEDKLTEKTPLIQVEEHKSTVTRRIGRMNSDVVVDTQVIINTDDVENLSLSTSDDEDMQHMVRWWWW